MAYLECQTALKNKLVTVTGLSSSTVTLADYSVLARGVEHAAVLLPSAVALGRNDGGTYQRLWDILIELYHAYSTEAASFAGFETLRAAVILAIDNDPNLGGATGVTDAILTSEGEIGTVPVRGGPAESIAFLGQRFRVTVYQDLITS